jgi:hypothetical protein
LFWQRQDRRASKSGCSKKFNAEATVGEKRKRWVYKKHRVCSSNVKSPRVIVCDVPTSIELFSATLLLL